MKTLIPILFLLAAAATTARSQSTSFTFDFWGNKPTDLNLQGNANYPSETTFLRLTEDRPAQVGRAIYAKTVQFWQTGGQVDFETTVNFIITPNSAGEPADGIAFFIAPVGTAIPSGSNGANLGIFGANGNGPKVFAVEFDTYVNGAWDPNFVHIGIDIGSRASVNTTEVGNAIIGREVSARINYVSATKKISVVVNANSQTFEVTYDYDLSDFLPQQVQVGLSASTGQHVAKHDIVSWYFTSTMNTGGAAKSRKYLGNVIQQLV